MRYVSSDLSKLVFCRTRKASWPQLKRPEYMQRNSVRPCNRIVIPTGAYPDFLLRGCQRRPRVRLSVERAACSSSTPRLSTGNPGERSGGTCCFSPSHSQLQLEPPPSPCHPDRSVAQWRDLQFLLPTLDSNLSHPLPLSSRPERSVNPTESPNQLIWTALIFRLFHAGPGRSKVVEFGQLMRREQKYDHDG
jgi:hypothetical protein